MGLATFGAGLFPIKSGLALHHMNLASALSMGILVGTALAAVIPEGVEMLIDSGYSDTSHALSLSSVIGISLLGGFLVMFLVDHYRELFTNEQQQDSNGGEDKRIVLSIFRSPLTLGLLLHSFVDGIALGSAFITEDGTFQLLFLVMITIHKLPTAFSLTVVLHEEGFSEEITKVHLLIFALTTPISSILMFLIVISLKLNSTFLIGILFLFSAGTFLYSVIHVIMEVMNKKEYSLVNGTDQLPTHTSHSHKTSLTRLELLLSIIGMTIPVLFTLIGAD